MLVALLFAMVAAFSPIATSTAEAGEIGQGGLPFELSGENATGGLSHPDARVSMCLWLAQVQEGAQELLAVLDRGKVEIIELHFRDGLNCDQVLSRAGLG